MLTLTVKEMNAQTVPGKVSFKNKFSSHDRNLWKIAVNDSFKITYIIQQYLGIYDYALKTAASASKFFN